MLGLKNNDNIVLIRGAGDIATGIGVRLYKAGFNVTMTEILEPSCIRRTVAFSDAVYNGETEVESIKAVLADTPQSAKLLLEDRVVPVLIDPNLDSVDFFKPYGLVDATLAKINLGINMDMSPVVIGIGPGFCAGIDCHAVVETMRGHDLGRVIYSGKPQENTGIPGAILGFTKRLVYAPVSGVIEIINDIGDMVKVNQTIAHVDGFPVKAPLSGVLRGIIKNKYRVKEGMKIGDVDPRGVIEYCFRISDKARAIGGGVLEALLHCSDQGINERKIS